MGLVGVTLLVSRLPADVYEVARTLLIVTSAVVLLLVAAGALFMPPRRVLARLFGYAVVERATYSVATEADWRGLVRAVLGGLVCLAVAGVSGLLRS